VNSTQTTSAADAAVSSVSLRRFLIRFVIASILSLVGPVNVVLFSQPVYRLMAANPTFGAVYGVLFAVWFGSPGRIWFLTFRDLRETRP
jgi:hypothetical protein